MNLDTYIKLDHGAGGTMSRKLIEELIVPNFKNNILEHLDDSAVLTLNQGNIAFTTDSYIIDPLFFPGGDIGRLAVCGTVNDLSMSGAEPLYLSAGFIIEEGFSYNDLERILTSMRNAADEAGVSIVTGDTKVAPKGKADKLFINTAGIGIIRNGIDISSSNAKPGDAVIVSGTIGDHGIAVLSKREGLNFKTEMESDVAPLNRLIKALLDADIELHMLRDPTRGGVASALNEIAEKSNVVIEIEEELIPIRKEVAAACCLLGLNPLHVANEGKFIAFLPQQYVQKTLEIIKSQKYGGNAAVIGTVSALKGLCAPQNSKSSRGRHASGGKVIMKTSFGGSRIVDMIAGEQLPRIC